MVGHNNMIPYGHFHKKWQGRIRTWFDQPMDKAKRKTLRARKVVEMAPRPVQLLRPTVHCPSARYNSKIRVGRGFTLQELKRTGLNRKFACTIGIGVDCRRRNRCEESFRRNVQRLKEYRERLILFGKEAKGVVKVDAGEHLNKVKPRRDGVVARRVTIEERKFEAYATLRRARADAKYIGIRNKRKHAKMEVGSGTV